MTKLGRRSSGAADPVVSDESVEAWMYFLLDEGLDALAAFRAIDDPSVRATFLRLMQEAATAARPARTELH